LIKKSAFAGGMILLGGFSMKKKLVIGVLENDSTNRFVYNRMVKFHPGEMDAYIFESCAEGTEKVQEINPDILFVDLYLQGDHLGGIEWFKNIKLTLPHTRFVAMTTFIQKDDREAALRAGFDTCVEKPLLLHDIELLQKQVSEN